MLLRKSLHLTLLLSKSFIIFLFIHFSDNCYYYRFDQLRVKRERCTGGGKGKMKGKPQKQNESVGYLLFHAVIKTASGQFTCQARSDAIKLSKFTSYIFVTNSDHHVSSIAASKPESAELHAIKNEYGSVNGGDEVWIRGSKMIGNRKQSVINELIHCCSP